MEFRPPKSADSEGASGGAESSTLRAFSLLELIASSGTPPTLEALTRASGLPKPTVYRILRLLARAGLVQREPVEKRYTVGPRTAALSLLVQMHSPLRTERRAILARLVEEIGETCNFTMRDGHEVVYLDRVETRATVRLHMEVGSRVPLHCTASGKLFLAQLTPRELRRVLGPEPFRRYTERTITTLDALERELRRIRASGIGTDIGECFEGSVCLAVPVKDRRGRVCAAVAVHGPAPRMTIERGYSFLPALRRAAAAIAETFVASEQAAAAPADAASSAAPMLQGAHS
jgi:DNA-binding IclR family transcriptional regulator